MKINIIVIKEHEHMRRENKKNFVKNIECNFHDLINMKTSIKNNNTFENNSTVVNGMIILIS